MTGVGFESARPGAGSPAGGIPVGRAASAPGAARRRGPSVALVCLGELPWGDAWGRNQSMVYQLARLPLFDRIVFVDPWPVWFRNELVRGRGRLRDRVRKILRPVPRVRALGIRTVGLVHLAPMRGRFPQAAQLEEHIFMTVLRWMRGARPYVLLNNHPDFRPQSVLHQLMRDASLRIFDLSDDFAEFYDDAAARAAYRASIAYSCANSDVVLAVNDHVRQKYAQHNPCSIVVPNATNYWNFHRDHYRPVAFLEGIRARGGPILGHTGTINRIRLDYELLEQLAVARPAWQFVFVGSAEPSFLEVVGRHPNLHHHPHVPYGVLPDWIHAFDVGVVPFRVNEHTKGNDLLKLNDYLAMGKPVVTTNMGGAARYGDLLWVAADAGEFIAGVEQALADEPEEMRRRRQDFAQQNSWEHRGQEVAAILEDHLERRLRQPSAS